MLTKLTIQQFKCFDHLELPLSNLTLLTGVNASGKSSVIQSVNLLAQSFRSNVSESVLLLNDNEGVSLGAVADIVNKAPTSTDADGRRFQLGLSSEQVESIWEMNVKDKRALSIPITSMRWRDKSTKWQWEKEETVVNLFPLSRSSGLNSLRGQLERVQYVSADRVGPRETYPMISSEQFHGVGVKGERTAWYLHDMEEDFKEIEVNLSRPKDKTLLVRKHIDAWMDHFFPGALIDVQPVPNTNFVTLGMATNPSTGFHRPQNVGYGLTHLLPIVVMCLGAKPGDILLIENPESHLHPSGQSEIGQFLAQVAMAGVQLIVETHSDHVLNGIRKAVKNKLITPELLTIHFFTNDTPKVISPMIDAKGNLDSWPTGFFDQMDKDMEQLIDWGL